MSKDNFVARSTFYGKSRNQLHASLKVSALPDLCGDLRIALMVFKGARDEHSNATTGNESLEGTFKYDAGLAQFSWLESIRSSVMSMRVCEE
jgi:hypothetical protein